MPTTTFQWFNYEVTVDHPGEFVHTLLDVADEKWTYVDDNGHGHFWKDGYPTLVWISEPCTMGHDDCDAEGHWECATCQQEIHPRTRTADPVWVAGFPSVTLKQVRYDPDTHQYETSTYVFDEVVWTELQRSVGEMVAEQLSDYLRERETSLR